MEYTYRPSSWKVFALYNGELGFPCWSASVTYNRVRLAKVALAKVVR